MGCPLAPRPYGTVNATLTLLLSLHQTVGMGACIRESLGRFQTVNTTWTHTKMTAAEGEAWGLIQALNWLISINLDKVMVEFDCKQADDVRNDKSDITKSLICKDLLVLKNNYQVVFTRQQANDSVQALTRASTNYATRIVFFVHSLYLRKIKLLLV